MVYNPEIHHRKTIRLKGYDYSQAGLYFVTLCCQNRNHLFGKIIDGKMDLNHFGKIAKKEWEHTATLRDNISLGAFILMPNHFHSIIQIDYQIKNEEANCGTFKSPSHTIGAIIRGYKGATTKKIKELIRNNCGGELQFQNNSRTGELQFAPTKQFAPTERFAPTKSIWQRNYWEHIIRNENEFIRISKYIRNNPTKWQKDKLNGGKGNSIMESLSSYNEEIWMV